MTTLIGIKAEKGDHGIILASDLSGTTTTWTPQGDVAYRKQTRQEHQKIYVNKDRTAAICTSGVFDQPYIDFLSQIIEGGIDLKEAIKKEFFSELERLNVSRWNGLSPSEDMNGLLVAVRYEEPSLYTCWPMGKVQERPWTSIGSGSDYVLDYIRKQGRLIPYDVSLEDNIDLVVASLDRASQDIYTGGLNFVIIKENGIFEFGDHIRSDLNLARDSIISNIKERLKLTKIPKKEVIDSS
ncbi:MAG: hypothetical protein V1663_03985 [archaeon]